MSIIDHLNELRRRLMTVVIVVVVASIASFVYSAPILELLTRGITLIYIRPAEAMMAHIRLAVTSGLMLSTPGFPFMLSFLPVSAGHRENMALPVHI
jgi:sec-independent protein translocase protein TatC